jgi:hypothetical protein
MNIEGKEHLFYKDSYKILLAIIITVLYINSENLMFFSISQYVKIM